MSKAIGLGPRYRTMRLAHGVGIGVLGGELLDGHPIDEPVQAAIMVGHSRAGMVGGTVQRVGQKLLRGLRLSDHLIQFSNLLANS